MFLSPSLRVSVFILCVSQSLNTRLVSLESFAELLIAVDSVPRGAVRVFISASSVEPRLSDLRGSLALSKPISGHGR